MKFYEAKTQIEKMDSAKTKADQMSHQLQQQIDQLTLKYNDSNALVDELISKYVIYNSLLNELRQKLFNSNTNVSELILQKQTLEANISTLKNEVKKLELTVLDQNFKIQSKGKESSQVHTNSMLNLTRQINFLQNNCEK